MKVNATFRLIIFGIYGVAKLLDSKFFVSTPAIFSDTIDETD